MGKDFAKVKDLTAEGIIGPGRGEKDRMKVIKVIEVVGQSQRSWHDAVQNAVGGAANTLRGITGVEVYNLTANVEEGRIVEYKANVKVAFPVEHTSAAEPVL